MILREINFGESRISKVAVLVKLVTLNFLFGKFAPSKNAKIHKYQNSDTLISRKI